MQRRFSQWLRFISMITVLSIVLAACGGERDTAASPSPAGGGSTAASASPAGAGGTAASASPAGGNQPAGADTGTVTILGAFTGAEEQAFNDVIAVFEQANPGIDVTYIGAQDFDTLIEVRTQAGDPPDIAAFPQPGGMARLARNGQLAPLWPEVINGLQENYAPVWQQLGSVDGTPYGVFHRVNAKGFVWYNKPEWQQGGYQAPQSWDDMTALSEQLKGTGRAPWCEGINAGAATGWKGTDWIENILLRTQGVEFYDRWVRGEVPFTSPEVRNAFEILGKIWMDPQAVYGGTQTIALTEVPQAATYLFGSPPNCWLHMQGSFVTNFFPEDVQQNVDQQVGFFVLPPIGQSGASGGGPLLSPLQQTATAGQEDQTATAGAGDQAAGPPLEIGGDVFTVLKGRDRPEVRKFMEFLTTVDSTVPWAKKGGALFPHKGQDFSVYPTEIERQLAQTVVQAEQVRFDGSDQMPSQLNQAFWKGITDWVSGNRDLDGALQDIEAARPK